MAEVKKLRYDAFNWSSWARNSLPSQVYNGLYLTMGAAVYYVFWPDIRSCQDLHVEWVAGIILRNFLTMALFFGGTHHMLYVRRVNGSKNKFNEKWPADSQHQRDRMYTTLSFLVSSLYEVFYLWCLANDYVSWYPSLLAHPVYSVLSIMFVPVWRSLHFYVVHRVLHPWRLPGPIDPGRYLYRWVHSHHHKSYNPGPWSGLSMHPVESTLYFTCGLVHFFFLQHPLCYLFNKFHCEISPIPGHHGFEDYLGQRFHYLHHAHFECNYGGSLLPLDAIFGTYRAA